MLSPETLNKNDNDVVVHVVVETGWTGSSGQKGVAGDKGTDMTHDCLHES